MAERVSGRIIGGYVGSQFGLFLGNLIEDSINPIWSSTWRAAHGNINLLQHPDVMAQGFLITLLSTVLVGVPLYLAGKAIDLRRRR